MFYWNAAAQTPADAPQPTFRVYTNLIQVPTLVLSSDRRPMKPIEEQKFYVSLDGGPRLQVTHARLEGDDPIALAILLDLTQSRPAIMKKVDDAIASLAPLSLHSTDVVAIYGLDCRLIRAAEEGLVDPPSLKRRVDAVLHTLADESRQRAAQQLRKGDCAKPSYLWDSLAAIIETLSHQSGRRVILALTDGVDRGSHNSPSTLRSLAQVNSVAIFGLVEPVFPRPTTPVERPVDTVCTLSGGIVLPADPEDIQKQLARALQLVRGRYIVEFPRPMSTVGGFHRMDITVAGPPAIILPTGAVAPTMDPAVMHDPNTIPADPSHAPQLGNQKVVKSN